MTQALVRITRNLLLGCLLGSALISALPAAGQNSPKPNGKADGLYQAVPKDSITPISNPVFITRAEAESSMSDNEPVLGLVDPATGQAKAYSIWLLDQHEIVNDRLAGSAIAVTW